MARLLTPAEIGIFSVGIAVVGMAHMLRGFGVGSYLIQEKELTRDKIRAAFTVALVIAWVMAGVLIALSGPMADFYDEPGVHQVMMVLSINFFLIPFSAPILALLNREMNFAALFCIGVMSTFAGAATSVTMAILGFGFMSLAWGSVAGILTTVVVANLNRPSLAQVLPSFRGWRQIVSF
ncbi:MAG: oligosaccharide flippase family protein, partial [Alphaproteobacteria bacterium]